MNDLLLLDESELNLYREICMRTPDSQYYPIEYKLAVNNIIYKPQLQKPRYSKSTAHLYLKPKNPWDDEFSHQIPHQHRVLCNMARGRHYYKTKYEEIKSELDTKNKLLENIQKELAESKEALKKEKELVLSLL